MTDAAYYGAMTMFGLIALGALVGYFTHWIEGRDVDSHDMFIVGLSIAISAGLAVFFGVLAS